MKNWLKILILIIVILLIGILININWRGGNTIEPPLVGCGGVHPDYLQECCNNWAEENEIVHIQCIGEWVIEDNLCKWECTNFGS